jgi:hypothetical protein
LFHIPLQALNYPDILLLYFKFIIT